MSYGFVYILGNECMPGIVKVGCTERSPHARAEELSKPTGVPSPFRVLCYAEFYDFQAVERKMHEWLRDSRVSESREFFRDMRYAVALLYFHPNRLAFTDATDTVKVDPDAESLSELVCTEEFEWGIHSLPDPFATQAERDRRREQLKRSQEEIEAIDDLYPPPRLEVVGGTEAGDTRPDEQPAAIEQREAA